MTHPPPAARRRWILASSALGAFAASVMATSVNVILPTLVTTFDTPFAAVQWVVLSYLMASVALLPIVSRLADLHGTRRVYLLAYVVFAAGSAACALAPGIEVLIAVRTLQGLGASALTALGLSLVTQAFPAQARGRAIGINGAVISAGIVVGPSLAGLVTDFASWRWVFAAGVIVGGVGLALALRAVPRSPGQPGVRFDVPGAAAIFVALLALSLALTLGQGRGFTSPVVLTLFGLAAVAAAAFVAIERRTPHPVVELRLFRSHALSVGLASGLATFVAISGVILLMPFYLEGVRGFAPAQVGLLMAVVPIVLVVIAPISGWAADRFGERPVTVLGMAFILAGYLAVGTLSTTTTVSGYLLRFLPVGIGMGIFQTSNNSAIMGSVPREHTGVGGGLLTLTRYLGQVLGTAVLASIWAARATARAGAPEAADATTLPATAQVAALQDVLAVVQGLILLALALTVWDLLRARRASGRGRGSWT